MAARLCWFAVLSLVICLHLVDAVLNYSPGSPQSMDEATRGSSPRRKGISSRLGAGMTDDGIDMVLTQRQYNRLFKGVKGRSDGQTLATPWKDGVIPYEIQPGDFDDDQLRWLDIAMRNWEEFTCVRFRPAAPYDVNRVLIRTGQGCWAHLGMGSGQQIVNLDPYCFWIGMIEHELGHTIGLIHEHQRPERDAYIRVNYFGVQSKFVSAVQRYADGSDNKMGLPYDYTSVMHYQKTAFAEPTYIQTLFPRDPTYTDIIGMTLRPSFLDFKLVNLMYKCASRCMGPPRCRDDCFLNAYCQCVCPEDLPQEHCEDKNRMCPTWMEESECHVEPFKTYTDCRKSCGICTTNGEAPQLPCLDGSDQCRVWAQNGDCETDKNHMMSKCRLSCGVCQPDEDYYPKGPCRDSNHNCRELADRGECVKDPGNMLRDCAKSCDFCPEHVGRQPIKRPGECADFDDVCGYWAANNLCQRHYSWMYVNCRKSCGLCDMHLNLPLDCVDNRDECHEMAMLGSCSERDFRERCKLSCNACDGIAHPNQTCVDYNMDCAYWASRYECYGNPEYMAFNCPRSCKVCPGAPPTQPPPCKDYNTNCESWRDSGDCETKREWMNRYCRVSCNQCRP